NEARDRRERRGCRGSRGRYRGRGLYAGGGCLSRRAMMVPTLAGAALRERLDHLALRNRAVLAAGECTLQFLFEKLQSRNAPAHVLQLLAGDLVGVVARCFRMPRQLDQLADRLDRQAEIAG